eukprot:SAG22_NODE_2244_length_2796_cov_2.378198_3_plen_137_part_00
MLPLGFCCTALRRCLSLPSVCLSAVQTLATAGMFVARLKQCFGEDPLFKEAVGEQLKAASMSNMQFSGQVSRTTCTALSFDCRFPLSFSSFKTVPYRVVCPARLDRTTSTPLRSGWRCSGRARSATSRCRNGCLRR